MRERTFLDAEGRRPFVVGLTGGVASGKSAVSECLSESGVSIVDTDLLAREVVLPGSEGLAALVTAFGKSILGSDGALDRRAMRERIFADATAKRAVEQILHPRIRTLTSARLETVRGPYAVLVVPLLVESGDYGWVNRVLVVDVFESIQRQRVLARDQVNAELADSMLRSQASRSDRLRAADDVVPNSASLSELAAMVQSTHRRFLSLAAASA